MTDKQALSKQQDIDSKHNMYKSLSEWPAGCRYTVEQKIEALTVYFVCGSLRGTERQTGIPNNTLHYWKHNAPWWDAYIEQVRAENIDLFDSYMTKIIDETCTSMFDRLKNGDSHVMRDGTIVKKPISFRDLCVGMGIASDKRQVARRMPTSYQDSSPDRLGLLFDKLAQLEQNITKPAINAERVKN